MMRGKMLAALLAGLILLSLAGCSAKTNTASNPQEISTAESSAPTKVSGESTAETTPAGSTVSPPPTGESTAEKETQKQPDTPAVESGSHSEETAPTPTETPVQTQKPETPPPTQPESFAQPTEPAPQPTEPAVTEPPHTEPTEPTEPDFNIGYWISYAQSYATGIGLNLESSAVSCWDNPIIANARCIYLERDIKDRLNWYNSDESITDVWIWAELRSDGSYDLYIGYA